MFLICNNTTNLIIYNGKKLDYMPNGYPRLIDENVAFPTGMVNVYEVTEVPEDFRPDKYCYTEVDGFYLNPDYVEPDPTNIYGIPDELFNQIKSDYREQITSEVSK